MHVRANSDISLMDHPELLAAIGENRAEGTERLVFYCRTTGASTAP